MSNSIEGRAFVFGSNLDTDQIYPGRYLELTEAREVARHAMEGADPGFVKKFNAGDIIVARTNFGCGSSREHAVRTLKAIGVGAVLAESFARIFYRNAINLGLVVLVCPGIGEKTQDGDAIAVDLKTGLVTNRTKNLALQAEPLSDYVMKIIDSGGIIPLVRKEAGEKRNPGAG